MGDEGEGVSAHSMVQKSPSLRGLSQLLWIEPTSPCSGTPVALSRPNVPLENYRPQSAEGSGFEFSLYLLPSVGIGDEVTFPHLRVLSCRLWAVLPHQRVVGGPEKPSPLGGTLKMLVFIHSFWPRLFAGATDHESLKSKHLELVHLGSSALNTTGAHS